MFIAYRLLDGIVEGVLDSDSEGMMRAAWLFAPFPDSVVRWSRAWRWKILWENMKPEENKN